MKLNIIRKEISGKEPFEFSLHKAEYIVKNFTDGDVYVSFEADAPDSESIKIPSMLGQLCTNVTNESNVVYVKGTGEVEVQQI